MSLVLLVEWTISFSFLEESIQTVICTNTPWASDHYGQTGIELCVLLTLTTLGTDLSTFLGETRGQERVLSLTLKNIVCDPVDV